jgi:FAD/FMN-containing dehydrogenase
MKISGWGRFPVAATDMREPASLEELAHLITTGQGLIARGNGRAYGDPAIGAAITLSMLKFDKILSFDEVAGRFECEAGVLLSDILALVVPKGWFPPVTPGTKFVSVGGMVAADVHGKNHHKDGSLGSHVLWLDVMVDDGRVERCSPEENVELFADTVGGMGLTGVILRCCLRLARIETAFIRQRTIVAGNLAEAMDAFEHSLDWTYSMAWIDCLATGAALGRSVIYLGEHAKPGELPEKRAAAPLRPKPRRLLSVPFDLPLSPLNYVTVRAFNACYFRAPLLRPAEAVVDYDTFFYPLDSILHWHRLYGVRGFVQYQCVLPFETSRSGLTQLLELASRSKMGSFLGVLKLFGPQEGVLSFPMRGYTLALDFPWSAKTANLLLRFDEIVLAHGGRLYLAKDARLPREHFDKMQSNVESFRRRRARTSRVFRSLQSQRLGL